MLTPRDYQQAAHDAAWQHMLRCLDPWIIDAVTGAGKSLIIAMLANTLREKTGKRVLCLAPSKELVEQNHEKYESYGNRASIMSASAGSVSMARPVVFGTPQTVKNRVRRFGNEFGLVMVDEAHGITPTIQHIIEAIREVNPNVRVGGLTATPYRLGSGYIFKLTENDTPVLNTKEPYFTKRVYRVTGHELIQRGYLCPPIVGAINSGEYENIEINNRGKFNAADIDRAYHGHGRLTAQIVADVVSQAQNRNGVMLFAATLQHAAEIMASLPPQLSAIVDGGTPRKERARIVARFKRSEIKYLVNVAVFTTGFDAPNVDVIAILRKTESVGLLQQIVGRGLRLNEGKTDCLVLDYAGNVEQHCPDGDLFNPMINVTATGKEEPFTVTAVCETCGEGSEFSGRPNPHQYEIDQYGYFVDLDGDRIEGDIPAHFGRRCQHMTLVAGKYEQCAGRWNSKECPHCAEDNDIAARYCTACKGEIVDPNEKLIADFKKMKRDPTIMQTDKIISMSSRPTVTRSGKEMTVVDFITEYRTFSIWVDKNARDLERMRSYQIFMGATQGGKITPETVTYAKNKVNKFYKVFAYNRQADEISPTN